MSIGGKLSTPEERKEQFAALKERLQSGVYVLYDDIYKMLYEEYYFIARPTKEEKEILELLSQYEEYVEKYWDTIEMPIHKKHDKEDEYDEEEEDEFADHPLYKIAESITNGNPFIMMDVEEWLKDGVTYYGEHEEQYEERGIEEEECEDDSMEVCWIGLVDSLIENEYAIEVDWNENAKTLADELAKDRAIKRDSSLLNKGWFSEEDSVADGCSILNKKWRGKGMCLGVMDIDSDSYVIFPCKIKVLEDLKQWAKEIGCCIYHAEEL